MILKEIEIIRNMNLSMQDRTIFDFIVELYVTLSKDNINIYEEAFWINNVHKIVNRLYYLGYTKKPIEERNYLSVVILSNNYRSLINKIGERKNGYRERKENKFDYVKYYFRNMILNILNIIYELKDKYQMKDFTEKALIVESCPIDEVQLNFKSEVEKVATIFNKNNVYPVVRYAVSSEYLFKSVSQSIPSFIHIVCHGDSTGISLLGKNGKSKILSAKSFIDQNEKVINEKHYVKLVYANSCYSENFVSEVRRSKGHRRGMNVHYSKTIGYSKKNYNTYAENYACGFYNELFINGNDCCKAKHCTDEKWIQYSFNEQYSKNIILCKR